MLRKTFYLNFFTIKRMTMLKITIYRDNFHCFTLDFCYLDLPQENKPISFTMPVGGGEVVQGRFVSFR